MTIVLHDSFLNAAQADLQSDKVLVKEEGLFSQTLYNLEQSLEKGSKALFSYYAVTHKKLSGTIKRVCHNNLKAIPQIFCQIFNIEVSFLNNIHIINPKLVLGPNFPKLKNMSLEGISALRKRIDRTFSQTITEKKNLLKTMVPKLIRPIMVMSNTWILFLPKQSR